MLFDREQYISHMLFQGTSDEIFCELFGPLIGLEDEWKAQGASDDELNLSAFGFDGVKYVDIGCTMGAVTGKSSIILEDNEIHTISIDYMGRHQRLCKNSATIPLPLDYPVKDFDDWLKIKHWYEFDENRIDYEKLKQAKKLRDKGYLVTAHIPGGFDEPRQLMGEEELCCAYYEQPELITDILDTISATALKIFERVNEIVTIDHLGVHEDMAGKSGPLAGPKQVNEFIKPYYRRIWDELSLQGAKLFCQDSDGNMNSVIDAFIDAGLNIMYPFEPAAGMDMVKTREKYKNKLAIKGGIDKHVLRRSKEEIKKELEYKLCDTMRGGGTVFAIDHRIPNGTPLENYRFYVKYAKELLGKEDGKKSDFIRMAF